MLLEYIKKEIRHICYKLDFITANESDGEEGELFDFNVSFIDNLNTDMGDISCNVSMILSKRLDKSPAEIAGYIKDLLLDNKNYAKVEIKNNFLNITLSETYLKEKVNILQENNYKYNLQNDNYKGKNILIEYTDPNPFKTFHIGHLMQNAIGQAISNLLEDYGGNIKRINYGGDIGLHIAKSIYGCMVWNMQISVKAEEKKRSTNKEDKRISCAHIKWFELKRQNDIDNLSESYIKEICEKLAEAYSVIHNIYETDEYVQLGVKEINKMLYDINNMGIEKIKENNDIDDKLKAKYILVDQYYRVGKSVSVRYFQDIYKILGSRFDKQIWESECAEIGERKVRENIDNGIFEYGKEKNGKRPVIYDGEIEGLHKRVFINSEGLTTYEAKDIGNFERKMEYCKEINFPIDNSYSIVITASEQSDYFKVLYSVLDKLYKDKNINNLHYSHGMMRFSDGKMSSRKGNTIGGMELLERTINKINNKNNKDTEEERNTNKNMSSIDEQNLAVSAIRYSILRQTIGKDIIFDWDKALSHTGDSGIYLQYCKIRFAKLGSPHNYETLNNLSEQERLLLVHILKLPDIYNDVAKDFLINKIVTYSIELARLANSFYESSKDEKIKGNTKNELLAYLVVINLKKCFETLGFLTVDNM